ncbi:molybdopterin-dependent oxidoreductase [Compostibacter hankyongensis]|uniref:4Fe-4S Mo/W bis-MGD-type domain-containing protein n=1 Tax=Compostibacter hankyongensis TaxID=1007089 RepID=A0ABP8FL41_9BACT
MKAVSGEEGSYRTTCCYCGVGCGIRVHRDKSGKLSVEGDPAYPVNRGMLCSKGMNLHYTAMDRSDRLLYPQYRNDRAAPFSRISWEQAMHTAAGTFREIIAEHGPDAVGFYVSGQCLTEEYYLVNKLVKGFIGSNNIDTNSRLCMSSAVSAYKMALGEDSVPGCYEDIELADTFLIAGANPAWCHPILFRRIEAHKEKNHAVKLIVVDPRRTQTAAVADLHLQIMPGTDIVLYHALARGLIENGFVDEPFIREHTEGFAELKEHVMQRSLQEAAAICGIRFTDIYKAVKYIGFSGGFISLWAMGLNQSVVGVGKNLALINLSLITGKIGKPGSGPFSLTGQPNAMGGREAGGMATLLPAHRDMSNPAHRQEVARYWGVSSLPGTPGLTATEMFTALKAGRMKAIWIIGTNPMVSIPDLSLAEAAMQEAAFVVVQDMSSRADTVSHAHLVLPAATWLEKEGTMTNSERRISYLSRVADPPGEALPDTEILLRFAQAMGWEKHFSYDSVADIYSEHAGLTRDTRIDISGLSHERLKKSSFQWPVPGEADPGTPRLFTDYRFYHPGGKARIHAVPDENLSEPVTEACPLVLTTGRIRDQWHTMTRSGKVNKLKQHIPHPFLEMHPADAAKRNIRDGDPVVVSNARGCVQVTAQLTDRIKKGVVFLPMHWGKLAGSSLARANNLTPNLVDPVSKEPDFKFSAVEVALYQKPPQHIILAGSGSGAAAFLEKYRRLNTGDTITWFCPAEAACPDPSRVAAYLQGRQDWPQSPQEGLEELPEISLVRNRALRSVDRKNKTVTDDAGNCLSYDTLILAAGCKLPFDAARPGEPVFFLQYKTHADALLRQLRPGNTVVFTGGNPALLEFAAILRQKGLEVHILVKKKTLLGDLLDDIAASLLEDVLTELGIRLHYGEHVLAFRCDGNERLLTLQSGAVLRCHALAGFSGDEPDTGLAQQTGLDTQTGIRINPFLQTSDPDIYALGEGTEYEGVFPYLPAVAERQAECLARCMHGNLSAAYDGAVPAYSWQIADMPVTVIGNVCLRPEEDGEEVVFLDRRRRSYKKCVIRGDRLSGVLFIGDQEGIKEYRELVEQGTELADKREQLLRPGNARPPVQGRLICSCRQVGEDNLAAAIRNGCKSIEALGRQTGAGTQCGSCKPELKELLRKLGRV